MTKSELRLELIKALKHKDLEYVVLLMHNNAVIDNSMLKWVERDFMTKVLQTLKRKLTFDPHTCSYHVRPWQSKILCIQHSNNLCSTNLDNHLETNYLFNYWSGSPHLYVLHLLCTR